MPPPPQLDRPAIAASIMTPTRMPAPPVRRFLVPSVIHIRPVRPPNSDAYKGRLLLLPGGPSREAEGAVVVMVSVFETVPPFGVTDGGANEHCDSAGRPLQEKLIVWLKPPKGVTEKVKVALLPAFIVAVDGEATTVKSMMFCANAGEVDPLKLLSPPYCAVIACTPLESALVVNAAMPCAFSGTVPSADEPSKN